MTSYSGPYGFRYQNKYTGLLTNSDAGKRDDLGWVEFPEGEPACEPIAPFTATCDGLPLSVSRFFPNAYAPKPIEASFRVTPPQLPEGK